MLGVGGLSLSLGRAGEGGGGSRGGGHLSRRMLLLERPFLPRFLHIHNMEDVFSERSKCDTSKNQPGKSGPQTNKSTHSKKKKKKDISQKKHNQRDEFVSLNNPCW